LSTAFRASSDHIDQRLARSPKIPQIQRSRKLLTTMASLTKTTSWRWRWRCRWRWGLVRI